MKCIEQSCFCQFGQVYGDVKDLVGLPELDVLLLSHTKVEGGVLRNRTLL